MAIIWYNLMDLRAFNTKMQVDLHGRVLNIFFYFIQYIEVNGYDAISLNVPIPLKAEATR